MPDFFMQFLSRLAVMLPVVLVLAAIFWWLFNRRRFVAFSPSDMRTWPLRFALLDGAVFAVTFALLSTWMADSPFSAGVAGGIAALVAMGLVPWLASRYLRPSGN